MGKLNTAQWEAVVIEAIADFEVHANRKNSSWSFLGGGMERLTDDFFLFNEYMSGFGGERLQRWSSAWGKYIIPSADVKEIEGVEDEQERTQKLNEKLSPILQPLSAFFAAFCHALREGENELTSTDAYWLGLIDEVIGDNSLLCLRHFEENPPGAVPREGAGAE